MKTILTLQSFGWFLIYLITGVAMLAGFTRLYIFATPYDERNDISECKKAPAVALIGAMLGFTIPIASMSYHGVHFWEYILWSVVSGVVQLICLKCLYWLLPKQIECDNVAAAIVYAGTAICVGVINAFSLIP